MIAKEYPTHILIGSENQIFSTFLDEFEEQYSTFKKRHIILDLICFNNIKASDINIFLKWTTKSKADKKSFIIVAQNVNIDLVSEHISCVPTLIEAQDTLEMEAIERDLGF